LSIREAVLCDSYFTFLQPLSVSIAFCSASMAGNLSANGYHNVTSDQGWVPQPDRRGTFDILCSCSITIFLCCWTSVIPNIPARTDGAWDRFRDKLNLAGLGILGPDFLFTLALGQWDSARRSVKV